MSKKTISVGAAIALILLVAAVVPYLFAAPQAAGGSGYHFVKKVKLGGTGGWDYLEVDPATHRLFISRGTHVIVVDPEQGKIVGDIPDTQGIHGIAPVDEFNKGFTSNGKTGDSTIFDLTSLKVTGNAKADKDADAISTIRFQSACSRSMAMPTRPRPSTPRRVRRSARLRWAAVRNSALRTAKEKCS